MLINNATGVEAKRREKRRENDHKSLYTNSSKGKYAMSRNYAVKWVFYDLCGETCVCVVERIEKCSNNFSFRERLVKTIINQPAALKIILCSLFAPLKYLFKKSTAQNYLLYFYTFLWVAGLQVQGMDFFIFKCWATGSNPSFGFSNSNDDSKLEFLTTQNWTKFTTPFLHLEKILHAKQNRKRSIWSASCQILTS